MAVKRLIESRNVSKAEKKKIKEIVQSIQTSQLTSEEHSEALNKILSIFEIDTSEDVSVREQQLNRLHDRIRKSFSDASS